MTTVLIPPYWSEEGYRSFYDLDNWSVADLNDDYTLGDEWPVSGDNITRYRKALAS